jgi:arylsulfatase A-like enzyme
MVHRQVISTIFTFFVCGVPTATSTVDSERTPLYDDDSYFYFDGIDDDESQLGPALPASPACTDATTEATCRALPGDTGGSNACLFQPSSNKCVNNPNFETSDAGREPAPSVEGDVEHGATSETELESTGMAKCASGSTRSACIAIKGPNGGHGVCFYDNSAKLCKNNKHFEDNNASVLEPTKQTNEPVGRIATGNCPAHISKRACRAITGPNMGPGACVYNQLWQKCVTNKKFVDNEIATVDCTGGVTKAACRAIKGPNGGVQACVYNKNKKACVNNKKFVDLNTGCTASLAKRACRAVVQPDGSRGACVYNKSQKRCVANKTDVGDVEPEPTPKQLNVLLIMADDVSADSFGVYGSPYFKTPRLDQLAKEGVYFRHMHATPICTPSRNKIMTGRSGIRNYVTFGELNRDEVTFGHMMQAAGYRTAFVGKKQLRGRGMGALGFDSYSIWNPQSTCGRGLAMTRGPLPDGCSRYWNPHMVRNGEVRERSDPTSFAPDINAGFIIDFMAGGNGVSTAEVASAQPFFVYYPTLLPHDPYEHTPDTAPEDVSFTPRSRTSKEAFRGMIAYLDKIVGRLVDSLDSSGLRDNTIVIFTSDNGAINAVDYPVLVDGRTVMHTGAKGTPTNSGTHVPLIVSFPAGVAGGRSLDDLVDLSDFLPTIADIANAALPDGAVLDGRSFWPQCQGKDGNLKESIFQFYFPSIDFGSKGQVVPGWSSWSHKTIGHGTGFGALEVASAQNQFFKLFRDGTMYAMPHELWSTPIEPGTGGDSAAKARVLLQASLDSMPLRPEKTQKQLAIQHNGNNTVYGAIGKLSDSTMCSSGL